MRVLLVDDDAILRVVLARAINKLPGVAVDEAGGVLAARGLLSARAYDAVISDEHMGDGLGHVLLADIYAAQPGCRRALMSGVSPPEIDVSWERFFQKPNVLPDLLAWVRTVRTVRTLPTTRSADGAGPGQSS